MKIQTDSVETTYRIGAVSRITGISPETLRAWERRYNAITPSRTSSGDRQYSRDDVAKLLLLKSLVDAGISIGSVAHLSINDLKARIETDALLTKDHKLKLNENSPEKTISRVALVGDGFPIRILDGLSEVHGIEISGEYENINELENNIKSHSQPDIVIIERPTINQNTRAEIKKIRDLSGAWHVILIYGFSAQELIEKVQSSQTTVVRSSVDVQELARLCIYHSGGSKKLPSLESGSTLHFEQMIPARRFSNKDLLTLAKQSHTIKCECPQHTSELIKNLVDFEIYSAECENENLEDAALHSYLHATTAQARSMLEEALVHLIRVDGISINQNE